MNIISYYEVKQRNFFGIFLFIIHNNFEIRYIQSKIMTALIEVQPCFDFYFKQAIESMQFSVI